MEKYTSFTKITTKYLHGTLEELNVCYGDNNTMNVNVAYEYNNYYTLNYEVVVDMDTKSVEFVCHRSNGGLNRVDLNRELGFEKAVSNYFFS
jgi:hypothetical protein